MFSQLAFLFNTIPNTTDIKVQYTKELTDSSIKSFSINVGSCFDDPNIKLLKDYINDLKTEVGNYYYRSDCRIWREYFDTSCERILPKPFTYTFNFNLTNEAFNHYEKSKNFSKFAEHSVIIFTVNGKLITRHTLPLLRLLFLVSKFKKDDWAVLETLQKLKEKYKAEVKKNKCIEHLDPNISQCIFHGYDHYISITEERLKIVKCLSKSLQNLKKKNLESNLDIAKTVLLMFVKVKMDKKIYFNFKTDNIQELFDCDEEVTHIFKDYDFKFLYKELLSEEENNLMNFFY